MKFKIKCFLVLSFFISFFSQKDVFANVFYTLPAQEFITAFEIGITTNDTGQYVYLAIGDNVVPFNNLNIFVSSDFGRTFSDPVVLDGILVIPQIITNDTGQFANVIWANGATTLTSFSSDFGANFSSAISVDIDSNNPLLTASRSGQFVYGIWDAGIIHLRASSDFGHRWYPIITMGSTGGPSSPPKISTDNSGRYVYAIWEDSSDKIQVRVSSDFGESFASSAELAPGGSLTPDITTNSDGQFGYAIWEDSTRLKVSTSSDFGVNWTTSIELGSSISQSRPEIATDKTGQFVHALWTDGTAKVQVRSSSDFGANFKPAKVLGLRSSSTSATPKLATDITGQYVYVIWNDSTFNVLMSVSTDFGNSFELATTLTSSPEATSKTFTNLALNLFGKYVYGFWLNDDLSTRIPKFVNATRLLFPKKVSLMNQ
ncbi:MAG: hypothetical protein K940chlam1_00441 [Candidatus Anoxychlamydiales bacterium]|nr:hypothetical protein [Candidatus Anoxychlamydiales bacterium]NGX35744.1 hypothetical protein [Candidatus Anoxychlamydiales bacterium]